MDKSLRSFIAELIGTFALVFVSAGAVCAAYLPTGVPLDVTGIALAQGLILAVTLTGTLALSGGYLNPAITITLWLFGRMEDRKALFLVGAQLLGSILAGVMLRLTFTEAVLPYGVPHLMEPFRTAENELTASALATGAGLELVLTFVLTFVIFATTIDPRVPRYSTLGLGLMPALAMVALTLVGFRLTGASLNPARALGPFLAEWSIHGVDFREHVFVYWIAPVAGAVAAGWVYVKLILPVEHPAAAPEAAPPAPAAPVPPPAPTPVKSSRGGRGRKK